MVHLLLAIIYLAFISLGLPDALLGAAWPSMYPQFDVPVSYAGIISMIIALGTVVSSLQSDRLTKKLGTGKVTALSVLMTAMALFGFATSHSFGMLCLWAIPYGLGAGSVDASLNNYVALHYESRHMSWLHCFWGVGTIVSPFVMSYALTNSTWNNGYRIVSFLQLGIGVLLLVTLPVWKTNGQNADANGESIGIIGALKIKGVPFLLTGFFAYCAVEATAMYWASTYLVEVKGITVDRAAQFASLFYIGLTIGRFLGGFIMNKLGDRRMILLGTCILSCGVISLMLPTGNQLVSLIGFIIIGFGCAPVYPCIIHSTPDNFGAEYSGAIIGIQMASAYVGSTFMPPLFGLLGSLISFRILPVYLAVFIILMITMTELTFKITAKKDGGNCS